MNGLIVVLVVMAAGIVVIYALHRYEQRQRAAAVALAHRLGYQIDVGDKAPPDLPFDVFGIGSSRRVSHQIWRSGSHDSAFQYRYTTGSGKNRQTHRRSCTLVEVPFDAPHLVIGPESFWSGVGKMIGIRDIEVESPQFNSRYRVRCADERFAITLLDAPMIAWMLSSQSGGGAVTFELGGRWMLCWGDRLEFTELFGFLEWAQHARTNLPTVLTSLYPPR